MNSGAGLIGSISMCLIKGFTEEFRNNDLSSIQSWVFVVVAISVGLI
jgi:hypothetical protein